MITLALLGLLLLPFLLIGGCLAIFLKARRRAIFRWCVITYGTLVILVLFGVAPYLAAWGISHARTRPPDRMLRETPAQYGVRFEDVSFQTRDRVNLRGWLVPPNGRNVVVVSSHGLFRNRTEVLGRIMALARLGYGALLYDFRSHGASERSPVSLGWYERNDVVAALEYVQSRYQDSADPPRIVLMGVSMGAVATLEAAAETRGYAALILDSPFASIRETVIRHSWLFLKMPRYPFPELFMFWLQRQSNFDADRVNSIGAMQRVEAVPLLLIASDGDRRVGADVARRLFAESRSRIKELKVFGPDVGHGAADRLHPEEYTRALSGFLDQALPAPPSGADTEEGVASARRKTR